MSDIILPNVMETFPIGTAVGIYRDALFDAGNPVPVGNKIGEGVVAEDGSLNLGELAQDGSIYVLAAQLGEAWIVSRYATPKPNPDIGPEGPQGPIGPKGEKGEEGPPGKEGPEGQKGKEGPQGKQGIEGAAGKNGEVTKAELAEVTKPAAIQVIASVAEIEGIVDKGPVTFIEITGNAEIQAIWSMLHPGAILVIKFAASPKVTDGGNLKLAGSFEGVTADDIMMLISNGKSFWYQIATAKN